MTHVTVRRSLWVLGAVVVLAGCGFQPVYMPTASGRPGPAERELAAIHVNLISERPGQELRQDLQQRLGSDSGVPSRYNLSVNFAISGEGIGILSDTIATRVRLVGNATWTLTAIEGGRITSGSARVMDAFNVLDQQYFAADMDNEVLDQRLASALADRIAIELAAFFRHQAAVASR